MKKNRWVAFFLAAVLLLVPMASSALTGAQRFEDEAIRRGRSMNRDFSFFVTEIADEESFLEQGIDLRAFCDRFSLSDTYQWRPGERMDKTVLLLNGETLNTSYQLHKNDALQSVLQCADETVGQILHQADLEKYYEDLVQWYIELFRADYIAHDITMTEELETQLHEGLTNSFAVQKFIQALLLSTEYDGASATLSGFNKPEGYDSRHMSPFLESLSVELAAWATALFDTPINSEPAKESQTHDAAAAVDTYEIALKDASALVSIISKWLYQQENFDAFFEMLEQSGNLNGFYMDDEIKSSLRTAVASLPLAFAAIAPLYFEKPIRIMVYKNDLDEVVACHVEWLIRLEDAAPFATIFQYNRLTAEDSRQWNAVLEIGDTANYVQLSAKSHTGEPLTNPWGETTVDTWWEGCLLVVEDHEAEMEMILSYSFSDCYTTESAKDTWCFDYGIVVDDSIVSLFVESDTTAQYDLLDLTGDQRITFGVTADDVTVLSMGADIRFSTAKPMQMPVAEHYYTLGQMTPEEMDAYMEITERMTTVLTDALGSMIPLMVQ